MSMILCSQSLGGPKFPDYIHLYFDKNRISIILCSGQLQQFELIFQQVNNNVELKVYLLWRNMN